MTDPTESTDSTPTPVTSTAPTCLLTGPQGPFRAHRGTDLRARSWRAEGLLRMFENVLEVGEDPENLIVYASLGKAARSWDQAHAIANALLTMEESQTLVLASGAAIGLVETGEQAPMVTSAVNNTVGRWATPERFYERYAAGQTMWGGLTAAAWQYIGRQGVLQGTYDLLRAVAVRHFEGGDDPARALAGRWLLTSGLGGMGSSQPISAAMLGLSSLTVEIDPVKLERARASGSLDVVTDDLDVALDAIRAAVSAHSGVRSDATRSGRAPGDSASGSANDHHVQGDPSTVDAADRDSPANAAPRTTRRSGAVAVGLHANAADVFAEIARRGMVPDVVTDQTAAHDARYGYVPAGYSLQEWRTRRDSDPATVERDARASIAAQVEAMLTMQGAGAVVFENGNNLRVQALEHLGPDAAGRVDAIPGFMEGYLRPLFARGIGPFRWVALSGDVEDQAVMDDLAARLFPNRPEVAEWISLAREQVPQQGLPARSCWLGHGERSTLALAANDLVADGTLSAPILFSRDHLDSASMTHPRIGTEGMRDGSDGASDVPILDALLLSATGADLVAVHAGGGGYAGWMQSAGVSIIADGRPETATRLRRCLDADTALGVMRHATAGYEEADAAIAAGGETGDRPFPWFNDTRSTHDK